MPFAYTSRAGGGATIVARPVGALDASGEASLTTLQQVDVSVAYDDLYRVTLSEADAITLLDSFTLDGSGSTFACSLSNNNSFGEVLSAAMRDAVAVSFSDADSSNHDAGATLSANLVKEIRAQFNTIFEDSLPNLLESEWDISNNVYYAAAAADMASKLNAVETEIIAQQLPESNYEAYMDASENTTTHALPLKGGDKLVFVFYLTQAAIARVNKKTAGTNVDSGVGGGTGGGSTTLPDGPDLADAGPGQSIANSGPYGSTQQAVTYATNTRTVAFELVMPGASLFGLKP